ARTARYPRARSASWVAAARTVGRGIERGPYRGQLAEMVALLFVGEFPFEDNGTSPCWATP
ncbi:MAG: hypothetical protein M3186_04860, partial [Actinomycetota bacterium]|nr:hypothetical protein [Actinomycetota bacterium]